MRKIDMTSSNYDLVADCISTFVGFGVDSLLNAFCSNLIENSNVSGRKKMMMRVGQTGIGFVTVCNISTSFRKNLDDVVRTWNQFVDVFNLDTSNQTANEAAHVEYSVDNVEVSNG